MRLYLYTGLLVLKFFFARLLIADLCSWPNIAGHRAAPVRLALAANQRFARSEPTRFSGTYCRRKYLQYFQFSMFIVNHCCFILLCCRLTADGAYASLFESDAAALVKVQPRVWTAEAAATVMCTHGTVFHSLVKRGQLRSGERVLVTGGGGVAAAAVLSIF